MKGCEVSLLVASTGRVLSTLTLELEELQENNTPQATDRPDGCGIIEHGVFTFEYTVKCMLLHGIIV